MQYSSLESFAKAARHSAGPVALILCEDLVEVDSTVRHHLARGFGTIALITPPDMNLPVALSSEVVQVRHADRDSDALPRAVTRLMGPLAGRWIYAGYNAEYLFHPFCETRQLPEMLSFHEGERRAAMIGCVVDLYARDLNTHSDAVAPQDAWLDRAGYHATPREDPENGWQPKERQLEFYGGLKLRFDHHIPWQRRRIDRVPLIRARAGLRMNTDFTWSEEELNTHSCAHHHNLTCVVASFRTAKALRANPGSRAAITGFHWDGSIRFDWTSQQLMRLGLMEPGQWF